MRERIKNKTRIYLIPHSHIDVQWYWNEEEGKKRAILIIDKVLKLMKKDSSFTFSQDNIIFFPYFEENLSGENRRILYKKIKEKKLGIVGGMWTQPEEAEVSGETLIRNILLGRNWIKKNFGVEIETAWQIDTFGHIPQLPQILKKANYKYLVFSRGVPPNMTEKVPSLFWGRAPDGSKILTLWMNKHYGSPLINFLPESMHLQYLLFYKHHNAREPKIKKNLRQIRAWLKELANKSPGNYVFLPVGGDNFIPQEEIISLPDKLNNLFPEYSFFFSTPFSFFKERERKNLKEVNFDFPLPLYFGDLRGTWEGRYELKKGFRKYENNILTAEKFATLAYLLGKDYPELELNLSWKNLAITSFHDNIGGSHTDEVEIASRRRLGMLKDTGMVNELPKFILENSLKYLSQNVKGDFVVFNPHSFSVTDICWINDKPFLIEDVPAFGYKAYEIKNLEYNKEIFLKTGKDYLENKFYRVEFNKNSDIKRILDKRDRRELIDSSTYSGNELIAISHDGDLEGMLNLKKEIWRSSKEKLSLVEEEKKKIFNSLTFRGDVEIGKIEKIVYLYNDLPRIDFITTIDLKKTGILLKVRFPLKMQNFKVFYSTQFAVVEREKGHFPAYDWATCENKERGIGLINTGNIGYWIERNYLDLVLLWSVEQVRPPKSYTAPLANELGRHTFTYSLFPYQGRWQDSSLVKQGLLLNTPLIPYVDNKQGIQNNCSGRVHSAKSFLKVYPNDFIITAFKKSEEKNGIVLRGYESKGESKKIRISFGFPVKRCWICNLLEKGEKELKVKDNSVSFHSNGFEIISLYLELEHDRV